MLFFRSPKWKLADPKRRGNPTGLEPLEGRLLEWRGSKPNKKNSKGEFLEFFRIIYLRKCDYGVDHNQIHYSTRKTLYNAVRAFLL